MTRPFRFGHQLRPVGPVADIVAEAQAAEAAGFDIVTIPDHIGTTCGSPMMLATAVAAATSTVRIGTFVLNNEMRNPVQTAWESATLDRMSSGRFELGLGAGHTPQEFAATGLELLPATVRKQRLAEATQIIRGLLDGQTVTFAGNHYDIADAAIEPPTQERLPILVGGNGRGLLTQAGTHADIVGFTGMRKTLADGQRHSVGWDLDRLDLQVARVHEGAADRSAPPELNALVQLVQITDDRRAAIQARFDENPVEGATIAEALATPYLAFGTHDEIAAQFESARDRWGISYFVTRDIEGIAPVIERLR